MKKRKTLNQPRTPKGIHIEQLTDEFRLYKIWPGKKVSKDPFLITDSVEDLVANYNDYCKLWKVKPDLDLIFKIISNNQKANENEGNFLKSGIC